MILRFLFIFLFFWSTARLENIREGRTMDMFGKIKTGLRMAGKLLGLDTAKGVAELVSDAFGKNDHRKGDNEEHGGNIFSGFLRMLGFDAKKIGAIAVNSMVFVAQLVSSYVVCIFFQFNLTKYSIHNNLVYFPIIKIYVIST